MANIEALIELLSDGDFHSGEEVGRQLNVSRTAVWKQLQKLSDYGLEVESVKGKGYRLLRAVELLNHQQIVDGLRANVGEHISAMDVLFDLSSTNDHAMSKLSAAEVGGGYVCFAEYQRQGRGRRGRQWVSPFACNLYASLVWEFEGGASALEGLSLVVGIAVARALKAIGLTSVGLKWPNDILIDGKKLGGILLEMLGDPSGSCQVVIGIGVNVHMGDPVIEIDQPWTALCHFVPGVSRNKLASALLNELLPMLDEYSRKGFAAYVDEWSALDAYRGREVKVVSGDKEQVGVAAGVAGNGALLLSVNGVESSIYGGEVSLRLHHDS
jgi:BirA family biotin operon repressor/biotin-[acetyl-CoA-carboxylase] ligase